MQWETGFASITYGLGDILPDRPPGAWHVSFNPAVFRVPPGPVRFVRFENDHRRARLVESLWVQPWWH